MGRFGGPVDTTSADAHGTLQLRAGTRIGVDGVPGFDLRRGCISPRRREPLPLEQGERGSSLEPGDGRNVGVRAALAHRHEQGAVLRDPLPLRGILGDDRASGSRLGVGAVDDLDLRQRHPVVAGTLLDVGARGRDLPTDDVRRAHAGRVVARDRVDAASRDTNGDEERDERGGEPPAPDRTVRPHFAHDRRRVPQDPRDERRCRRRLRHIDGAVFHAAEPRQCCQVGSESGGGLGGVAPARRVTIEQAVDEDDGVGWRSGRDPRERRRRLVGTAQAGREPVLALERHSAREEPEEDAAEGVQVGRGACLVACGLLGRPVLRRPGEHAGDRRATRGAREPCEPEVGDHHAPRPSLDEDVRRGEVAVDNTARVRVGERGGHRRAVPPRFVPAERSAADDAVQRRAFHELHDEHRLAVVLQDVVEADQVRVLEAGERRRLPLEALPQLGVVRDPRVEDLERDVAAQPLVACSPDHAHAPTPELLVEAISVGDGVLGVLHGWTLSGLAGRRWTVAGPGSDSVNAGHGPS